jgi:tetratricopeptide (TPR) repeat protein
MALTYQNIDGMKRDLNQFLIFYNFNRLYNTGNAYAKLKKIDEAIDSYKAALVAVVLFHCLSYLYLCEPYCLFYCLFVVFSDLNRYACQAKKVGF